MSENKKKDDKKEVAVVEDWRSRLDLVRAKCAEGATDQEFSLFLYMAKRYDLDPLLNEIYLTKYWNKKKQCYYPASIFSGRDGFLKISHRSKNFDGMETTFRKEAGELVARCQVWNKTVKHPIVVEVYFNEYTTGKNLWTKKPRTMLGKVAESQALRKAFQISGIYDQDEMGPEEKELNKPPGTDNGKTKPDDDPKVTDLNKMKNGELKKWLEENMTDRSKYLARIGQMKPSQLKKIFSEQNNSANGVENSIVIQWYESVSGGIRAKAEELWGKNSAFKLILEYESKEFNEDAIAAAFENGEIAKDSPPDSTGVAEKEAEIKEKLPEKLLGWANDLKISVPSLHEICLSAKWDMVKIEDELAKRLNEKSATGDNGNSENSELFEDLPDEARDDLRKVIRGMGGINE